MSSLLNNKTCAQCGEGFRARPSSTKKLCSRSCYAAWRSANYRGTNHPNYKGRIPAAKGYVRVYEPGHPLAMADGYVLEHRKVLWDAGIRVPDDSEPHHKNHDRSDNRLENLEVLTKAEHNAHHHAVGTVVRNQYGSSTVGTVEERKERDRIQNAKKPPGWWKKYAVKTR